MAPLGYLGVLLLPRFIHSSTDVDFLYNAFHQHATMIHNNPKAN
jgi:hypothetical protein